MKNITDIFSLLDIALLIEGLETIKSNLVTTTLLSSMVSSSVQNEDDDDAAEKTHYKIQDALKNNTEKEEDCAILKAKLITIKRKIESIDRKQIEG